MNLKKIVTTSVAALAITVTTFGALATSTYAAYTGTLDDFSATVATSADPVINKSVDASTDLAYSGFNYLVNYFTQASILEIVLALGVIALVALGVVKGFMKILSMYKAAVSMRKGKGSRRRR